MLIPFYGRYHAPEEADFAARTLSGELMTEQPGGGEALALLKRILGKNELLLTPSCSSALELAAAAAGIGPGDEVLLPSFNFPSAANAVLRCGALPVLCDISPDTQNISAADAERRVTPRTRAIIAVHYAGVSADLDALGALCRTHRLLLIEDAAQGIGAAWSGRPLGTIGDFGALSFHFTKNITCGEGGALYAAPHYFEAAEVYAMHGTDRSRMLRGVQKDYSWQVPGSCYPLGALSQSILQAQLLHLDEITAKRLTIARIYNELLRDLPIQRMIIPEKADYNGHIYYFRCRCLSERDRAMEALRREGIDCKTHYFPLHMAPAGKALGYAPDDFPESRRCWETLVRLPIHTGMTVRDAEKTALAVRKALE